MPEEPTFTLKAGDRIAPSMIRLWIAQAKFFKVNSDKIRSAELKLAEFIEWRKNYGAKLPT